MKKVMLLFVLAIGFVSFANSHPITESFIKTDAKLYDENSIVMEHGSELSTFVLTTDVSLRLAACTATVTYNGVVQATFSVPIVDPGFTGMACQLASSLACNYIHDHGGSC